MGAYLLQSSISFTQFFLLPIIKMREQTTIFAVLILIWATISSLCLCDPLSEFSIVGYTPDDTVSEFRAAEIFQQWREKHGKVYKHLEEEERRFETFRKNLAYVIERNTYGGTMGHKVGLNAFADLSNEEFREVYLSKISKPMKKKTEAGRSDGEDSTCKAPASLDWRRRGAVTGVKNQGSCGMYCYLIKHLIPSP